MPVLPAIARVWWPMAAALLLATLPSRGEWKEGELRTAAYVAHSVHHIYGALREKVKEPDPFGNDDGVTDASSSPNVVRLEAAPWECRFFRDGDGLWEVTRVLRQAGILDARETRAVFNQTTRRVVVRAALQDQWSFAHFWEEVLEQSSRLLGVRTRLLQVRAPEVEAIPWTAELVNERGAEELIAIEAHGRAATRSFVEIKGTALAGSQEIEPNLGANGLTMSIGLNYAAKLEDGKSIALESGLVTYPGMPRYLELGSRGPEEDLLVLEVTGEVYFLDGTPAGDWQVFEDAKHQPPRAKPGHWKKPVRRDLGNALFLGIWPVPPTFAMDIAIGGPEPADEEDFDPFAADGTGPGGDEVEESKRHRFVNAPPELGDEFAGQPLMDVGELVTKAGIAIPEGGWVCFAPRLATLIAKLDADGWNLLDQLAGDLLRPSPLMVHLSLSLLEGSGAGEAGEIPEDARRVGRAALTARPGQKAILTIGRDEKSKLVDGFSLEIEPDLGADSRVIDLNLAFQSRGARHASLDSKMTLQAQIPVVIPLGKVEGKPLGVVIEARAIDPAGEGRQAP